jgi:hypothetical protein
MEFRLLGISDYTCRDESDEQYRGRAGFSLLCERLVVAVFCRSEINISDLLDDR